MYKVKFMEDTLVLASTQSFLEPMILPRVWGKGDCTLSQYWRLLIELRIVPMCFDTNPGQRNLNLQVMKSFHSCPHH